MTIFKYLIQKHSVTNKFVFSYYRHGPLYRSVTNLSVGCRFTNPGVMSLSLHEAVYLDHSGKGL